MQPTPEPRHAAASAAWLVGGVALLAGIASFAVLGQGDTARSSSAQLAPRAVLECAAPQLHDDTGDPTPDDDPGLPTHELTAEVCDSATSLDGLPLGVAPTIDELHILAGVSVGAITATRHCALRSRVRVRRSGRDPPRG